MPFVARYAFLLGMSLGPGSALAAVDYQTQVEPILRENCYKCHGGPRAKKDFRMDVLEKFQEHIGPDKYIVPGDPQNSEVIKRVILAEDDTDRMPPPRRGERLSGPQVAILRAWIQEGAKTTPGDPSAPAPTPTTDSPSPAPAVDPTALHTFTSTQGTQLKAYFVRMDGSNVVLRSEAGQEKSFPVSVFSDDSKQLLNSLISTPAP